MLEPPPLPARMCLTVLLLLAACGSPPADQATSTSPAPGPSSARAGGQDPLPATELIVLDEGAEVARFRVEIADEVQEQRTGLMFVRKLPEDHGMAFVFDEPRGGSFYMKDTLIPLDIAFWDEQLQIIEILRMQPCTTELDCPRYRPESDYIGALEVNAGALEAAGVQEGHTIRLGE